MGAVFEYIKKKKEKTKEKIKWLALLLWQYQQAVRTSPNGLNPLGNTAEKCLPSELRLSCKLESWAAQPSQDWDTSGQGTEVQLWRVRFIALNSIHLNSGILFLHTLSIQSDMINCSLEMHKMCLSQVHWTDRYRGSPFSTDHTKTSVMMNSKSNFQRVWLDKMNPTQGTSF